DPAPLRLLAVADVGATQVLVEPGRVRLGLPLQPPRAKLPRLGGDALEQGPAETAADPRRLDPEILEPPDFAARDQPRPADLPALRLRHVEPARAQGLRIEI